MKKIALTILLFSLSIFAQEKSQSKNTFTIAQLKYDGGGDWYANPSSLPNLLEYVRENTGIPATYSGKYVELTDDDLFNYPFIYMTGHGNVKFSEKECERLRAYLTGGGFLHADDNYGMDESFRREMKKVFPEKEFVELPFDHPIFHCYFEFTNGLPKIHEHDNKVPQGFGLFHDGRLIVFYSYESDLGDGWEDESVHNDSKDKREQALKMGTNIVVYALTK